ncbi:hypothetical protein [Diaphorobacter limosus]|uniref:Uncharacterized protein n=1 Tax=Diaphorobacter limosus TaxID=3036128 RepID=A0ABZ0IZW2_9BURK|nr:hypothetical protein [Diaphorobacter sp. Y-1]WOO30845.1 hypothetical protein P4826_10385 [Diaphorobacter sp. Y-1]
MQGLAQYASNGSMGDNARAVSWFCSCIAGLSLLKALSRDVVVSEGIKPAFGVV